MKSMYAALGSPFYIMNIPVPMTKDCCKIKKRNIIVWTGLLEYYYCAVVNYKTCSTSVESSSVAQRFIWSVTCEETVIQNLY